MNEDLPDGTAVFIKRPVAVTAVRIEWQNLDAVAEWCGGTNVLHEGIDGLADPGFDIPTDEGTMRASVGDWVIRGVEGEFYPCRDSVFRTTYQEQA